MTFQLAIAEKPGYLHFTVTGPNTFESVMGYMQAIGRECEARQCFRILIEENLTGRRLETWDVYQIAAEGSRKSIVRFEAIAYVDLNAHGELMKFAETVVNNRGLPMTVFPTIAEAESWLARKLR